MTTSQCKPESRSWLAVINDLKTTNVHNRELFIAAISKLNWVCEVRFIIPTETRNMVVVCKPYMFLKNKSPSRRQRQCSIGDEENKLDDLTTGLLEAGKETYTEDKFSHE